ncbi:type VII secretion protein EssC [Bifidobacterium sp. ESL0784]|uniref:type VII secretion protein EssC n=1 Tax=Bifidobacterium sp. ESL0784 TaxID=2983231 RepID=UPI0023F84373|nr:type VII secretion protein EssC [Bifidobacterium sp. ESL0784]MDF7641252.1 type VII secretion protein EssC [Bifidobacterium sp. ESL0784]
MLLTVLADNRIHTLTLADKASGMQWITVPLRNGEQRVARVEAHDGSWVLSPRKGSRMVDSAGRQTDTAVLLASKSSAYAIDDGSMPVSVIARNATENDKTFTITGFVAETTVTIGRAPECSFAYESPYVSTKHASIRFVKNQFVLTDLNSANGTYVNGARVPANSPAILNPGDVIEILGLIITVGFKFLSYNHPDALKVQNNPALAAYWEPPQQNTDNGEEPSQDTEDADYFYPAPRFKRDIKPFKLTVDAPPAAQKPDKTSIASKIGPSMVMVLGALVSGSVMAMRMQQSNGSILTAIPMLVMAVSMIAGSILWPIINRHMENKQIAGDEKKRRQRYAEYLDQVRAQIANEAATQKAILHENRISVQECVNRALRHDPRMMDRTPAHDDFLELRLGVGTLPLAAEIKYPDEHFSIEKDDLSEVVYKLAKEPTDITEVPVSVELRKNAVIGICGSGVSAQQFLFGLVSQLAALHSYEDVKLVLICNPDEREQWAWAQALPHIFSNDKSARYFATSMEEASELSLELGKVAQQRREEKKEDKAIPLPCYVVLCTSKKLMEKSEFIDDLARHPSPGFTLVCMSAERKDLPKQCTSIIELSESEGVISNVADSTGTGVKFIPDIAMGADGCLKLSHALASTRLDIAESHMALPDSLGFMDMYKVGNVEQLNVRKRWQEARASETLAARIGLDPQGEPFYLNLHEKFHGPHGLIAGTTGSGKSEFIITWILSMCVQYSPEEAAFVLIDYKGGGLAGAFDNNRYRLPHLAGTITNLDGAAVTRSMVSIQSELKRRQALFNEAREAAGGDNVDIYDYLRMYHEGKVKEPCPHLFIVADEFAELKQQEPEFLDELVSAARIGRSLGVHLVLATQKPSGVVNDQIWSNSKFKVSLKVSDAADSKEMIQRPDAAELTQAGRFYLLVGYNELFAEGQAAYSGGPYRSSEQYEEPVDDAVVLIGDTGRKLSSAHPASRSAFAESSTPELVAVLGHICDVARSEGLKARQLWLDPIPALVKVEDLESTHDTGIGRHASENSEQDEKHDGSDYILEPIVGVLDDPEHQEQRVLSQPLTAGGNLVMYGGVDSGIEQVLLAMLFDLVKTHDASHCNIYVLDLGSEALGALRRAPQVGDVVVNGEDEKVLRLFDMLESMVTERRGRLAPYGGSFDRYVLEHDDMPSVVFVLNGVAAFTELYEQTLMDRLVRLSRDMPRVGMTLIVVAGTANEIRGRLRSNLKSRLVFALDDPDGYMEVLGSMRGVVAPSRFGQGLVRLGEVTYLFQGAQVLGRGGDEYGYVERACAGMAGEVSGSAVGVPVMPERVDAGYLAGHCGEDVDFPFGVYEGDLTLAGFDFRERPIERVVFNRTADGLAFVRALLRFMSANPKCDLALLDVGKKFADLPGCCSFETQDDGAALDYLCALGDSSDRSPMKMVFVSGMSGLLLRGLPDKTAKVTDFLTSLDGKGAAVVLFDTPNDAMYGSDSWFTAHSSSSNGVWVGAGLDGQNCVQHTYGVGERVDPKVKAPWGYVVLDGGPRKVNLLACGDE